MVDDRIKRETPNVSDVEQPLPRTDQELERVQKPDKKRNQPRNKKERA